MHKDANLSLSGERAHTVTRDLGVLTPLRQTPAQRLAWLVKNWSPFQHPKKLRTLASQTLIGAIPGTIQCSSRLYGRVLRADYRSFAPEDIFKLHALLRDGLNVMEVPALFRHTEALDYGLLSTRVVTTTGVNFLVDAFQGTTEPENLNFHGFGTGTNAEAVGNTALQTEFTTEYATDNTRPTGVQGEGASANIYRTTATFSPNAGGTLAVTEHGIFSQAATGGGTLWDRSIFSAINLVASADSLQTQYDLTVSSGG